MLIAKMLTSVISVSDVQRGEGAEDRDAADHQRQAGRREAAEDDDEQHQQDRERERLGARDVLLDLGVDVDETGTEPPRRVVRPSATKRVGDLEVRLLALGVVGAGDADDGERRAAVVGDERGGSRGPVGAHRRDGVSRQTEPRAPSTDERNAGSVTVSALPSGLGRRRRRRAPTCPKVSSIDGRGLGRLAARGPRNRRR